MRNGSAGPALEQDLVPPPPERGPSDRPGSALRARMIEDMKVRGRDQWSEAGKAH
jgi:hypothetical protein